MDFLNTSFAQLKDLFQSMTPAARITAALLLALCAVAVFVGCPQPTPPPPPVEPVSEEPAPEEPAPGEPAPEEPAPEEPAPEETEEMQAAETEETDTGETDPEIAELERKMNEDLEFLLEQGVISEIGDEFTPFEDFNKDFAQLNYFTWWNTD